ncbi:MAG: aspartyl protease family protein [Polymorphobacter sp.]
MFLLAIAAALAVAAPEPLLKIPPASIDNTLEVVGENLEAEERRSRLFVDVRVNGRGPYSFLVDSGADRSVIGAALAERLALPKDSVVKVRGMSGSSDVASVFIETLRIGSSDIDGIIAPALPERFIGAQGIIGIDALTDQRLLLDFDAKTVTIQDSRLPAAREQGEIVVTARRQKGQLILTQVSVDGARSYAVIDTGAEISIGNRAMLAKLQTRRSAPLQKIALVSVTGENFIADLAVLPELRIGGIVLQNVQVAFTDAPPFELFGLEKQPALLLGTDLLKSFKRLSLDFRNRKVRFTLRR